MTPDVPATFKDALAAVQAVPFMGTRRYQEQQWRAERKGAHPDLLLFERLLVRRMAKIGVPMFATEVMRSPERQKELHAAGFSQIAANGAHQCGCAVDIVHGLEGWKIPEKAWLLVGHVGKEVAAQEGIRIKWGGDWRKPWDPAHWELADWRDFPIPF